MVDIVKFLPNVPTSFPLNVYNQRSKTFDHQVTFPISLSNSNIISQNDRLNNTVTKRWIGNCPSNPPRLIDVTNAPYSIHRKIMYQELSRHCPTATGLLRSGKSKQQQNDASKEASKTSEVTTANIISQPSFSNGNTESTRLFETLSKHVTIKPEPLRPSNSFFNSSTNTLTSWQRYWTSTNTQRRRKEPNEPEPTVYRQKHEQVVPGRTHFVVLRDSPLPLNVSDQYETEITTATNSETPTNKSYNLPVADKPIRPPKDDDTKKLTRTFSKIEFVASSLIPSSVIPINSSSTASKVSMTNPVKTIDKGDQKDLTEKSLVTSSEFKSDSLTIEEVSEANIQTKPIITKVYKLSIPTDKSKQKPRSPPPPPPRRIRSKSNDKKGTRTLSASKRKRQPSGHKKLANKSDLSQVITTTSRSRVSQVKWDEPYVGVRFDPPTPACSPSLFVWLKDSDPEDNDSTYEKSEVFEQNLPIKVSKN